MYKTFVHKTSPEKTATLAETFCLSSPDPAVEENK